MRLLLVVLGVSESLIHSSPSEPRRAIFHDSQPGGIAQLVVRMHWQIRDPRAMRTCGEVDDTVAVGAQYLFAVGWTRSLSVVVLSLVRVIVARVIVAQVAVGPMLLSLGLNYSVLRLGAHVKITITCIFASKTFGSYPSDNRPSPPFRSVRRPICPGMTKKKLGRPASAADPPGPLPPTAPGLPPLYLFTRPLPTSCRLGNAI